MFLKKYIGNFFILTTLLLAAVCQNTFAQKEGLPFIQNYFPPHAGAQNWEVVQDDNGLIYVGNNSGVLQYDGNTWRMIQVSNSSTVRSLAYHDGVVFVGAEGEFGYLQPTSEGDLQYHSLVEHVDTSYADFGITWKISPTSEGIFIRTSNYLFRWDGQSMKAWKPDGRFGRSYQINDKFYINHLGKGLMVIEGDSLKHPFKEPIFLNERIWSMLPHSENGVFIMSSNQGAGILNLTSGKFEPMNSPQLNGLQRIYNSCTLPNGNLVFATLGLGVWVFNPSGELVQQFDKSSGLQDDIVINVFAEASGDLWCAMNIGIDRLEISTPIRTWNEKTGLPNSISDLTRFNNELLVGTAQGLFRQKEGKFVAVDHKPLSGQTWKLEPFVLEGDTSVLIANADGLMELTKSDQPIMLDKEDITLSMVLPHRHPSFVLSGSIKGVKVYQKANDAWSLIQHLAQPAEEIESMAENENGEIWVSTNDHLLYKLTFPQNDLTKAPSVEKYGETEGVPNTNFSRVHAVNGEILLATQVGILRYNSSANAFEPYFGLGEVFASGEHQVFTLAEDPADGAIWLTGLNTNQKGGKVNAENAEVITYADLMQALA